MDKSLCFFLLLLINVSTGYTQQNVVCKGQITDSTTNSPLNDVSIYRVFNGDTVLYKSNAEGSFQISLQTGSRLLLKKSGYAWKIARVNNSDILQIKMVKSKPTNKPSIYIINNDTIDNEVDVYFDGQIVPLSEINDAYSISPDEIGGFTIITKEKSNDGKGKIYIISR